MMAYPCWLLFSAKWNFRVSETRYLLNYDCSPSRPPPHTLNQQKPSSALLLLHQLLWQTVLMGTLTRFLTWMRSFIRGSNKWTLGIHVGFFSFFFFKLEDNCFTILCWPLPYINMNQPQVIMYPLPPEPPPSFPISSHPRLSQGRGWSGYEYKYFQALLRVGRGQLCLNGVIHMFTEF